MGRQSQQKHEEEHKIIIVNDMEYIFHLIDESSKPVIICGAVIKNSKTLEDVIFLS